MAQETKIQWCDSTVNPIMGCAGCELFLGPVEVLKRIDAAARELDPGWKAGDAKRRFKKLVNEALEQVDEPGRFKSTVTTTHIHHFRNEFAELVDADFGSATRAAVEGTIAQSITCYAATLHLNRGLSLKNPARSISPGYAPTFEVPTQYPGRVTEMAREKDLLGKKDPDRPWVDGLPRLVFVSDMGDAFSRKKDFAFLREDVIEPIRSADGQRHLWLWLTKRPKLMKKFADSIDGFPDNVCAMTTVVTAQKESLERIDDLREVDAKVRGLSIEPLWERLPLEKLNLDGIDWVILGGESGASIKDSRPFELEWVDELHAHCKEKGVAFFLKQLGRKPTRGGVRVSLRDQHGGDWDEWPEGVPRVREFPPQFSSYREDEATTAGARRPRKGGMTSDEAKRFAVLDKQVAKFAKSFVKVADALFQIRNDRLYRAKYATFQEYCESVHKISRQYANRLIKAAQVQAEMVPIVSNLGLAIPENEAQLRELVRLPDTQQRVEVIQQVIAESDKSNYTAKQLRNVVDARLISSREESPRPPGPTQRLNQATGILDRIEDEISKGGDIGDLLAELRAVLCDPAKSSDKSDKSEVGPAGSDQPSDPADSAQ